MLKNLLPKRPTAVIRGSWTRAGALGDDCTCRWGQFLSGSAALKHTRTHMRICLALVCRMHALGKQVWSRNATHVADHRTWRLFFCTCFVSDSPGGGVDGGTMPHNCVIYFVRTKTWRLRATAQRSQLLKFMRTIAATIIYIFMLSFHGYMPTYKWFWTEGFNRFKSGGT